MRKHRGVREFGVLFILAACGGQPKFVDNPQSYAQTQTATSGDADVHQVDPKLCSTEGMHVATYDLNHDDKPDLWKIYRAQSEKGTAIQAITCKQVDLDHDGKQDYVVRYDETGNIILEEYDLDFDGKFDTRMHYNTKTGKRTVVERTAGFAQAANIWEKYDADGKLQTIKRDRNNDGKPDYWEEYREGILEMILYDDDFDGRVDRRMRNETPHKAAASAATVDTPAPTTQNTTRNSVDSR